MEKSSKKSKKLSSLFGKKKNKKVKLSLKKAKKTKEVEVKHVEEEEVKATTGWVEADTEKTIKIDIGLADMTVKEEETEEVEAEEAKKKSSVAVQQSAIMVSEEKEMADAADPTKNMSVSERIAYRRAHGLTASRSIAKKSMEVAPKLDDEKAFPTLGGNSESMKKDKKSTNQWDSYREAFMDEAEEEEEVTTPIEEAEPEKYVLKDGPAHEYKKTCSFKSESEARRAFEKTMSACFADEPETPMTEEELIAELEDLAAPEYMHLCAEAGVSTAFDKDVARQPLLAELFKSLIEKGFMTGSQLNTGIAAYTEFYDDLRMDIPQIDEYAVNVFSPFVEFGILKKESLPQSVCDKAGWKDVVSTWVAPSFDDLLPPPVKKEPTKAVEEEKKVIKNEEPKEEEPKKEEPKKEEPKKEETKEALPDRFAKLKKKKKSKKSKK